MIRKPTYEELELRIKELEGESPKREQAEEGLQGSEKRYRILFEESPISLWEEDFSDVKIYIERLHQSGVKDLRGHFEHHPEAVARCAALVKVVDVNKATLELYGAKAPDDFRHGLGVIFTKESYDVFREELIALAKGETRFESEATTQTLKGDKKHIVVRWSVAPGFEETLSKVFVSILDITARKQVEEALRQSEGLFRMLFENHTASELIVDPDTGSIVDANPSAAKFYGWTREQLRQMKIQDINTLPFEEIKQEMERARAHEESHFEFRHRRADGSIRNVDVFSGKIEAKGKDLLHSIIHDTTDRKRAEKALRQRVQQLRCLYSIGDIIEKTDTIEGIFRKTADILPYGLYCPELSCARITFGDQEFKTQNFEETAWKVSADIIQHGKPIGTVEIRYPEEMPHGDERPSRTEVSDLLNAIAERLGRVAERKQIEENLQKVNKELKDANDKLTAAYGWIRESRDLLRKHQWKEEIGFIVDREGKIVGVTERALECTGRSRAELIGHHIMDFIDESCHEEFKSELRQAWIGIARNFSVVLKNSYESEKTFQATLTRLTLESRRSLLVILR